MFFWAVNGIGKNRLSAASFTIVLYQGKAHYYMQRGILSCSMTSSIRRSRISAMP